MTAANLIHLCKALLFTLYDYKDSYQSRNNVKILMYLASMSRLDLVCLPFPSATRSSQIFRLDRRSNRPKTIILLPEYDSQTRCHLHCSCFPLYLLTVLAFLYLILPSFLQQVFIRCL